MAITDIVLDFDGTCTQIPVIYKSFLDRYLIELNKKVFIQNPISPEDWNNVQQRVIANSPNAAWTISICPSAPAAADPYILAYESTKSLLRSQNFDISEPPFEIHKESYEANQAPWRLEARDIFEVLLNKNIKIHFVSNSNPQKIKERLCNLLSVTTLPSGVDVLGNASKFRICELTWDTQIPIPNNIKQQFINLHVSFIGSSITELQRPVYLRRGAYFETIYFIFGANWNKLTSTVFCGDIWEMDLAMPYELGANVHLIERAIPFSTYHFERKALQSYGGRGKISNNLLGLLEWL